MSKPSAPIVLNNSEWNTSAIRYMQPKINDRGGKSINIISTQSNRSLHISTPLMMTWGISDYVDEKTGRFSKPIKAAWSYGTTMGWALRGHRKLSNMASGGTVGQNVLVGEGGPEIVTLPMGARVHSNSDSRRMGGNMIHVHVNGRVGASDMEIKDIADKVAREINLRMNRTGSVAGRF